LPSALCPYRQIARYACSDNPDEARQLCLQHAVSGKANRGDAEA
jgi:hypothetical protein